LTPRTRSIVPVHLYGHPCDMEPILAFAAHHALTVVEDCAQAAGACYDGRKCGTFGDAAAFSFYPTKNLGALGDGGAVVTRDPAVAAALRLLRNYGQDRRNHHLSRGINSRLDELQAAVLRVKLHRVDRWNEARRARAAEYARLLRSCRLVALPVETPRARHVYHLYVVRTAWRDRLARHLLQRGIQTQVHYPIAVHRQPAFADLGWPAAGFPCAERLCNEVLSLPMFPELPMEAVARVAESVAEFKP
jgi:dTDP-3-amino-3,4,6-trideoxy-alpha-D-glucose transaminase